MSGKPPSILFSSRTRVSWHATQTNISIFNMDDPFLYQEELRASSRKGIRWDDLPLTVTADIFRQVGYIQRLIHRRSEKDLHTSVNSYFNPEFPKTTQTPDVSDKYYGYDLERFVVALRHMACMAQKQELNLPPPPHPVPICPRHDTCTICTCLAASSGYYKAFGTCRNMTAFENSGELKKSTYGFCSWFCCAFAFVFPLLVVFW